MSFNTEGFQSMIEHMPSGVSYCKMLYENGLPVDFRFLYTNPAFEHQTGLQNVTGKLATEVMPGIQNNYPDLLTIFGRIVLGSGPEKVEIYLDSLKKQFSISAYSPTTEHFVAVYEVIPETAVCENSLNLYEEKLQALFKMAPLGITRNTMDGRFIEVNPAFLNMIGYSSEEFQKMSYWDLTPEEYAAQETEQLASLAKIGRYGPYDKEYYHYDGHRFQVCLNGVLITDSSGEKYIWSIVEDVTEKKSIERKLKESEVMFSALFNESSLGISVSALADGRFIDANNAFLQVHGYERDEIIGHSSKELGLWIDLNHRQQLIDCVVENGVAVDTDVEMRCKSGDKRTVMVSMHLTNIANEPCVLDLYTDITERKCMVEALLIENKKNQAFLMNASDGVTIINLDGQLVEVSNSFCNMLGYSRDELIGMHVSQWDVVHNEVDLKLALQQQFEKEERSLFETRHRRKDGSIYDAEISGFPVEIAGEKFLFNSTRDITERKNLERKLADSEAEFRLLAESMPQIVWACDAAGLNTYINQQWAIYTGSSLEDSHCQGWGEPFHPEDQQVALDAWLKAVANKQTYTLESRIRRIDGVYRWWLIRAVPILDQSDQIQRWFGTSTDIDDIKQTEKKILRLNRLYQVVSATNHVIVHIKDRDAIFQEFCRIVVELGGFKLCWVGLINQQTGLVDIAASAGEIEYLDGIRISTKLDSEGYGPTGRALREDSYCICNDFLGNEITKPWHTRAQTHGINSSASIVIKQNQVVIGALTLYAGEKNYFDSQQEELLLQMGADISFAIDNLLLEARVREAEIQAFVNAERELAGMALLESEERHRLLAETMLQGVVHHDADGRLIKMNPAAERFLGVSVDDLLAKSIEGVDLSTIHEDGSPFTRPEYPSMMALKTGNSIKGVVMGIFHRVDKKYRWISIDAVPLFRPNEDKPFEVYAVFEDITERKLIEEQLRHKERLLSESQAVAQIGSWMLDLQTEQITWSDETFQLFGFNPLPLRNPTLAEIMALLDVDDQQAMQVWIDDCIANKKPKSLEIRVRGSDNSVRWLMGQGQLESNPDGQPIYLIGTVQDITEHKMAEAKLRQADSRKDEFLAMLAHELRNPLTPINNVAQMLTLQPLNEKTLSWASETLNRNVSHIIRLVDDLLDVSRITQGLVNIEHARVELVELLKNSADSIRGLIQTKQQVLKIGLPEQPIYIDGDSVRLTQIFVNLLGNAAKYTFRGGFVSLTVELVETCVVVRIVDNGMGIDADLLPHVYDLFVQGKRGLDRSEGGVGIGLTLVKRLVELHGGEISVSSQGYNQGSEFVVKLPALIDQVAKIEPSEPIYTQSIADGLNILLVDDNVDLLDSISLWLEMHRHHVHKTHNGPQGIMVAQKINPDVILLDIGLPIMDGYQVAKKLREQPSTKDTLIIGLSGYLQNKAINPEFQCFDHYLVKPPNLNELQNLLIDYQQAKKSKGYT